MLKTTKKTVKVQVRPNTLDSQKKKEFYQKLQNIQYYSFRYANECVQRRYLFDTIKNGIGNDKNQIKEEDFKNVFGDISIRNLPYKYASTEFKENIPSSILTAINNKVYQDYKNMLRDVYSGRASLIRYKKNMTVPVRMQNVQKTVKRDQDGDYTISILKKMLGNVEFKTVLGRDRANNKLVMDKIVNGRYKLCDSHFQFNDKNKLFLLLTLDIPVGQVNLDPDKIVGVDLGINIPLFAAVNYDDKVKMSIGSREGFLNQRLAIQNKRKSIQKGLKYAEGGRGRNKKLKKLDDIKKKEKNFVNSWNHKLAREVVNFAVRNGCGTIHLEYLKGMFDFSRDHFFLRNWSYFDLQNKIEQKAKEYNILVLYVDPKNTSKMCSNCGHTDAENRKKQYKFKCLSCEHESNADNNAARNISLRDGFPYEKFNSGLVGQPEAEGV